MNMEMLNWIFKCQNSVFSCLKFISNIRVLWWLVLYVPGILFESLQTCSGPSVETSGANKTTPVISIMHKYGRNVSFVLISVHCLHLKIERLYGVV